MWKNWSPRSIATCSLIKESIISRGSIFGRIGVGLQTRDRNPTRQSCTDSYLPKSHEIVGLINTGHSPLGPEFWCFLLNFPDASGDLILLVLFLHMHQVPEATGKKWKNGANERNLSARETHVRVDTCCVWAGRPFFCCLRKVPPAHPRSRV